MLALANMLQVASNDEEMDLQAATEDARAYVIDDVEAHLQAAYKYEATKGQATCCHTMWAPPRVQRTAMATWLRNFAMMVQPLHHAGSAQAQEDGADYLVASLSDGDESRSQSNKKN